MHVESVCKHTLILTPSLPLFSFRFSPSVFGASCSNVSLVGSIVGYML